VEDGEAELHMTNEQLWREVSAAGAPVEATVRDAPNPLLSTEDSAAPAVEAEEEPSGGVRMVITEENDEEVEEVSEPAESAAGAVAGGRSKFMSLLDEATAEVAAQAAPATASELNMEDLD
jgi:hypothetical protein